MAKGGNVTVIVKVRDAGWLLAAGCGWEFRKESPTVRGEKIRYTVESGGSSAVQREMSYIRKTA
jgi:hypothetical protein